MRKGLLLLPLMSLWLGCAGENRLGCEDRERYAAARSAAPIRVPDDLSLPDESEALTIPPAPSRVLEEERPVDSCLESPPDYFEGERG